MSPTEKKKLAEYMATLDRNERMKLLKRASLLRKVAVRRPIKSRPLDDEYDDAPQSKTAKTVSLDEYVWRIVSTEEMPEPTGNGAERLGVVGVSKTTCDLMRNGELITCNLKGSETLGVSVGDEVFVQFPEGRPSIAGLAPRRTVLSRPDVQNQNKERVIAANIDSVVVVVSVISPPLHPRIIDRYMVAIQRGGCRPVLAVNKLDLLDGEAREEEMAKLDPYRALDIPIFECSAHEGKGIHALRAHLCGQTAAFVGHSGVGKSSLVNAFDPTIGQEVGGVSEGYGRGTHTTTRSALLDLGDLKVIDTPGIRSFGIWDMKAEDLKWYFPEFATAGRCKFKDCSHTHEPDCAIKLAVRTGEIAKARYETFKKILESL